jgi:surfeit locus 1 family protein
LRLWLAVCAALLFAGFAALGTWQVERRAWKLDLIARVEQRVHAPAVAAPAPDQWPTVSAAGDEYRHVRIAGTFLHDRETLVQAATELGGGFWVLTPLRMADGRVVLVNRGFVPPEARERTARGAPESSGETVVTGLLRMTEPGGGFLRKNDPAGERWYSRDVQAIAAARGLRDVAPFFVDVDVDADATEPRTWPAGGLTVIAFHNSHLVYALTWYGLALMVLGAAWFARRQNGRDEASEDARPD